MKQQLDTDVSLADRTYTSDITGEFLEHHAGLSDRDEAIEALEWAVKRFERTYNAVAAIQPADHRYYGDLGFTIRIIQSVDADEDEIRRGLQTIQYWVAEEYDP